MYDNNLKSAPETASNSPVTSALNDLAHSQSITDELIDQLASRLSSVLEPVIPFIGAAAIGAAAAGPAPCAPPDRSELHGCIGSAGRRQARYNEQLRALIDRLTV